MLSRGNSEASARLRRAKSSASIKTRHSLSFEPCISDPSVARDQALAAASHAFGHAAGPESSYKAARERTPQSSIPKPDRALNHSQSIRFAGPTALSARGIPITTRAAPASHPDPKTHLGSFQAGLRRHNSSIQGDGEFMTALPSYGQYVETRVASQPSSYRKLRRSKSMFNSQDLSKMFPSTGLHPTAFRTRGNSQPAVERPSQALNHAGLRLGRPFTFLRPQAEQTPCQAVIGKSAQEEAVTLARDQYLYGMNRLNVDEKQWVGNAAIRRRSQKTFRKTVRTSSTNSFGSAVESPESLVNDWSGRRGVGGRARALSSSFKNRLKRVFNRSSAEEGTLPIQHLQASRPHFGGTTAPLETSETRSQRAESPHFSTPDCSSSRQEFVNVPSRQGSLARSTHSADKDIDIDDKRSRVTSWTNSTAANTIAAHQNPGRKRLSIIQENGIVPSRLGSLRPSANLQAKVSAFHGQPRKSSLYAKLQQRMSKSHSISHLDAPLVDGPDTSNTAKENSEMPRSSHLRLSSVPKHFTGDQSEMRTLTHISALENGEHCSAPESVGIMQSQVKAEGVSGSTPKGPLRESKSMFFPQSTHIERSRTSPFRQAMQSNSLLEQKIVASVTYSPYDRHEGAAPLFASYGKRDGSVARSESIYSRTSSGDTPQPCKVPKSLRIENEGDSHTTSVSPVAALEIGDDSVRSTPEKSQAADILDLQERISKQCLSSESGDPLLGRTDGAHSKKRTGHKREHAQFDGEDTDRGRLQAPNSLLKGPSSAPIGLDIRSSLRLTPSQPMIDRFPLMSINTQKNANYRSPASLSKVTRDAGETGIHQPSNQIDTGRENVRPKRSTASLSSPSSNLKAYGNPHGESKDRGTRLHDNPQNGSLWPVSTPVSHSRSSPERIARLRRMYSSNTLGSPSHGRNIESSTRLQKLVHNRENKDRPSQGVDVPDVKGDTPGDCIDITPDSRKMVDTFLSNRRQARGDDVFETVFI
ncbi:MAG: hypothetical protein LQ343_007830 [Gyalolechia ehrenbergii]|nr:MAG: hypothetical protein LQ343_007830 [Gyalolechia ehrenbergii]